MEVILLAIVTFIFAIDQFSFLESLYRPIVAGPIIGAILGDIEIGLVVGGTYELMMIGNMPVGGAQPPNAVIGVTMAVIFATQSGLDANTALGLAIPFSIFGQYAVTLTFTFMAGMMALADKAAEDASPKGIAMVNYLAMAILGGLFSIIVVAGYFGGSALGETLAQFSKDYSWVMAGLGAAGGMMRYVGFAILMKIMLSSDLWGIYFAGFAAATIIGKIDGLGGSTLLLVAFIGIAIALYDFQTNVAMKKSGLNVGSAGGNDGI